MRRLLLLSVLLACARAFAEPAPFIVEIDAGHGGSNTGAPGLLPGLYEKRLTLVLGALVAARLADTPGVSVILTREGDRYVTLRERVRRANADHASLFISIHANASPTHGQRGFETYVISPEALGDARAMRAGDGPPRRGVDGETAAILDDLERGASVPRAARLARRIQQGLARARGSDGDRGVREGSMDVLLGASMPAVLVEVGFIDHPVEGLELWQPEVQAAIADAITDAVLSMRESGNP